MIRKYLYSVALILIMFLPAGCGGGAGSLSSPEGVNTGVPSIVQLIPVQQVVQTNSYISLRAKVLDGNGTVCVNVPVVFTNLSLLGVLSSTTAATDSRGYATVSLFSTDVGFATIQAEVNTGSGKVRDRKMVFFSPFDLFVPGGVQVVPTLTLDVDSNANNIYDEPGDYYLKTGDAIVRATVMDDTGMPVLNDTVTFNADSTELTFPDGSSKQTDSAGQAFARVKVVPSEIRNFDTPVNVSAVSTNTGAFNVITLFLTPIEVGNISVVANPAIISSGGSSTISATVTTAAGTVVPDGTAVNFTSSGGVIVPFGQTTNGVATAQYTAPTLADGSPDQTFTITAAAGGQSASTLVTVTSKPLALTITPGATTVASLPSAQTVTFTITGGSGSYTTVSSDPTKVYNGTVNNGTWTTSTVTATVAANAVAGAVTLTVYDSAGATTSATVTITTTPLSIVPGTYSVVSQTTSQQLTFTITGGTGSYTTVSSDPAHVYNGSAGNGTWGGSTISATVSAYAPAETVTLTVSDSAGATKTATITITTTALTITPSARTVVSQATTQTATFTVSGGTGPYTTVSSDPTKVYNGTVNNGSWTGSSFTITVGANVCPGTVTLTVYDSVGGSATATITIIVSTPLAISPTTAQICEDDNTCSAATNSVLFTLSGGTPPYSAGSSDTTVIANPGPLAGTTFTVTAIANSLPDPGPDGTVNITATDACGTSKTAVVTVINQ